MTGDYIRFYIPVCVLCIIFETGKSSKTSLGLIKCFTEQ